MGFTIGSIPAPCPLTELSADQARDEVAASKMILEMFWDRRSDSSLPIWLANEAVRSLVVEAVIEGVLPPSRASTPGQDPYLMRRIDVFGTDAYGNSAETAFRMNEAGRLYSLKYYGPHRCPSWVALRTIKDGVHGHRLHYNRAANLPRCLQRLAEQKSVEDRKWEVL